jgi:hypothetical protein
VGFTGLTAETMNITVFRGVKPCSLPDVYGCFGGIYCLHLQVKDWSNMFIRNVIKHLPGYMASHSRRQQSSLFTTV